MVDFLNNLNDDLRKALLIQLRNLWTHTSTAIDLIYNFVEEGRELGETYLFALHKAVQTDVVVDV